MGPHVPAAQLQKECISDPGCRGSWHILAQSFYPGGDLCSRLALFHPVAFIILLIHMIVFPQI